MVFFTLFSGCGGTGPSRFYTLNSLNGMEAVLTVSPEKRISVLVNPVEIPDYLDRPQIVTRTGRNELTIAEFDRWTGSLREDIERVLIENLSILLSQSPVSVVSAKWGMPLHYRLAVNVTRFDVVPEGNVELKAQWTLVGKDRQQILVRESSIRESIEGKDYSARVSAMSRSIEKLSRNIAQEIQSVSLNR
jgi:uncharacterized lipoprotein YmbA